MTFQRYFALHSSTFPFVFCCIATWFLDRLFVEFGHRTTYTEVCIHNDLQYVTYHQWVTVAATVGQTVIASRRRRVLFERERVLLGGTAPASCLCHLYLCQCIMSVLWTTILACALDFSPWLCIPFVLENRATVIASAICTLFLVRLFDRFLYERTLAAHYPGI